MSEFDVKRLHICNQPHNAWCEYIYNSYYPNSPHNSKHLFDIYTSSHLFWPMFMMFTGKKIFKNDYWHVIAIIIAVIVSVFEIHENLPKQIRKYHRIEVNSMGKSVYRGDSTINILGDLIVNFIGIYLGYVLSDVHIIFSLFCVFIIMTNVVGLSYWTDFLNYLFLFPIS